MVDKQQVTDKTLHIDFETRSRVDLPTQGGHVYATDPSTEVLMAAYAFDDGPVKLWLPCRREVPHLETELPLAGPYFPAAITEHIAQGGKIVAFNAQFERLIFWYVICPEHNVPEPKLEQFICAAAQARCNNLPGGLANCARFLGGDHQKDHRGNALIKLFCIPNAAGDFNDHRSHPDEWAEFCAYCIDDTEAERDILGYMRAMTPAELEDYYVNERINDAGLMIDRELAEAAVAYADDEQRELVAEIKRITNGAVQKARGKFITQWVYDNLPDDDVRRHMHTHKSGERRLTFDKNARARLLDEPEIAPHVREVIECSDWAQAASTGKYKAMALRADPEDDRVRGSYIFAGAGSTGRYSARGLQTHNLPRKGYDRDVSDLIADAMCDGVPAETISTMSGDNIMQTLKGLLRYSVMAADGYTFVCADLGQIEGRVNPWLAMGITDEIDRHVQEKLAIYADPERDVYLETASDILRVRITDKDDPRRQGYGKVPELSLGFGGGAGAFLGMAHNYGVQLPRDEVEQIVQRWRESNPWAQPFWYRLFDAAVNAMQHPGEVFTAGRIRYTYAPHLLDALLCLLPSGRMLTYPQAKIDWKENKFGKMAWQLSAAKAAWTPKADEKEWPRVYLWPGLLCENVTQAAAADVLRECLAYLVLECSAPVVGHTHDEALIEVPRPEAEHWAEVLRGAMVTGPEWAEGLPLAADVWIGDRYRK